MRKNQRPNQVSDPWYIPAVPTGKPEFGAPNCPVRALRYYHRYRYMSEHLAKTVMTLFSTRVKMSAYANPFIELAPVLDDTPQINSCMITTNKNTHI